MVTLLGQDAALQYCGVIEVSALSMSEVSEQLDLPIEIKELWTQFAHVFEAPKGLPPRRKYDHTIPLTPGTTHVSVRPYRVDPHLKTEMEKQVRELLQNGMIKISRSPFQYTMLMVKNKDDT